LQEKHRLEKLVQACDKLKHETVRKISLQPMDELARYREILLSLRKEVEQNERRRAGGEAASGSAAESDGQHQVMAAALGESLQRTRRRHNKEIFQRIDALHQVQTTLLKNALPTSIVFFFRTLQNIQMAYENISAKHDKAEQLHDSLITIGLFETPEALAASRRDEIVVNFARDDKFPSGLFIACCMLQEIFQQCMMYDHLMPRASAEESVGSSMPPANGHVVSFPPRLAQPPPHAAPYGRQPPGSGVVGKSPVVTLSTTDESILPLTSSGQSNAAVLKSTFFTR